MKMMKSPKSIWKRIFLPVSVFCCAILCMGMSQCAILEEDPADTPDWLQPLFEEADTTPPKAVVSIHSIVKYPRGENSIERKIMSYTGEECCIKTLSLLSSKEITRVRIQPRESDPDMYDLYLTLTDRGRKMWIGLSVAHKGAQLAFVIDGMLYRKFTPRMLYDDVTQEIMIDGPFDPATALEIMNNAAKTHKKLNR